MVQILHGRATTTAVVRRAIQHSQESLRVLANRYGINQKIVAKWQRRTAVADLPTGPKDAKSRQEPAQIEGAFARRACNRRDQAEIRLYQFKIV